MSDAQGRPKDDDGSDGTNDNLSNIIVDDDELPSAVVAEAGSEEDGPPASTTPTSTTTPNNAGEGDTVANNCAATIQQEVKGVANTQENGVVGSSGNSGANALASILGRIVAENTSAKIMASQAFIQPLSMAATALQYNTNQAVCTTAVLTNRICNPNIIGTLLNSLDGVLQTTNWLKGLALQYLTSVGGGGVGGGVAELPPTQPAQYYWGGGNNANDANNEEQPEIIDSMPPSQEQQIVNRHKRRRLDAATIFAPKFMKSINTQNIDKMEWKDTTSSSSTKRREGTVRQDAMDIRAALMAISRGNTGRASEALVRFLDSKDTNDDIRRTVKAHLNDVDHQIVQGLKASIAHHTNSKGGTRSLAAETFVKDVVTASVWHIVAASKEHKIAMGPVVDALGTNRNQLQHGIDRAHALIDTNKQVEKYKREERKDKGFKKGKGIKNAPSLDPRLLLQQQQQEEQEDNDFLHFSTNTEYNNLDDDNGL
jgi:hypothetical protein